MTRRSPRRALPAVIGVAAWAIASHALAYSSFPDYLRSIEEGGGGGRLFSGTPADAHGCDVCHRGATAAPLEVLGLPVDGYVPGQSYEIRFQWPASAPHVALMAELTDPAGTPSGTPALVPYAAWEPSEICENGFPAADLCRVGGAMPGCCREVAAGRDACSFPGERSVLWVLDCGSRSARMRWTAPPAGSGDVWFSASLVNSDVKNDARGDGAMSIRRRLRPAGDPIEVTAATGTCGIGPGAPSDVVGWIWIVVFVTLVRRRARSPRTGCRARLRRVRRD